MISTTKAYWVPLLKLMAEMPAGQADTSEVVELFYDRYGSELAPRQLEYKPDGRTERWRNNVEWARLELVKLRYMDSPERGVWRITAKGLEWLDTHPDASEIEDPPMRPTHVQAKQRPMQVHSGSPTASASLPGITLAQLENTRKFMPAEDFRRIWGELYDQLLAEQRAHFITHIDRQKLVNTVIEQIYRIQGFVRGQSNDEPLPEQLCDWIYQCYLYGLYKEAEVLWPLVDETQVDPWYYKRTERIAVMCKAKR